MTSTEGLLLDAVTKSLGLEMITGHSIMLTCWRCGEQFCIVAHTVINKDMAFYTIMPPEPFIAHRQRTAIMIIIVHLSQMSPTIPKFPFTISLVPTTCVTSMTEDEDVFYDCL
jgi:hypothetical protein